MPIGYLIPVALIGWAAVCALTRWWWLGPISRIPALLASELPFLAGYLLVAATVLAAVQGDLATAGGAVVAVAALGVFLALAVGVRLALQADAALHNPPARRPWGRILAAPLPASRRDVVRVRDLAYGEGRRRTLDVYHRTDRPVGAPVMLHIHGGAFFSGSKRHEARPLLRYLADRGMVCASADYRLRPRVTLQEQIADVVAAVEWVRARAQEYGGDSERIVLAGSSAGAYLAIAAVNAGASGVAGVVGRYGYYGDLTLEPPDVPLLVIHGQNDLLVRPRHARAFVARVRDAGRPAEYVELPGAQHNFDRFESIRAHAVGRAVEGFIATTRTREAG